MALKTRLGVFLCFIVKIVLTNLDFIAIKESRMEWRIAFLCILYLVLLFFNHVPVTEILQIDEEEEEDEDCK